MRVIVSIATGLALCGCPIIDKELANQKTEIVDSNCAEDERQDWFYDGDGDGYGDTESKQNRCDPPGDDYITVGGDCDDSRAEDHPGVDEVCDERDNDCNGEVDRPTPADAPTWYADADSDGYGLAAYALVVCFQPDGYVAVAGDCDDTDALTSPDGAETCDGIDNDCDGFVDADDDDMVGEATWYIDLDADGHGDLSQSVTQCEAPAGYVRAGDDCDDSNALVFEGAEETCDGLDNDCDGLVDDDDDDMTGPATWYRDADADGYGTPTNTIESCSQPTGYVALGTDCNDADSSLHPSVVEVCDEVDNNCDGTADEGVTTAYYLDSDGDGYGLSTTWVDACSLPSGYVENDNDCNDADPLAWMGATESCDGSDNNCDGTTDPDDADGCTNYYYDYDQDGWGISSMSVCSCTAAAPYSATEAGDCDDNDAVYNSGAGNCGLSGEITDSDATATFTGSAGMRGNAYVGDLDYNQDGFSDILVGQYTYDSSYVSIGSAALFLGPTTGTLDLYGPADADLFFSPASGVQWTAGWTVSHGDFDGDGWTELLIGTGGAPGLWILEDGLEALGTVDDNHSGVTQYPGVYVGYSVGDLDGDGADDAVLFSDRNYDVTGTLYWGSNTGLVQDTQQIEVENAASPKSVDYGDLNGDGVDDLVWVKDEVCNASPGDSTRAGVNLSQLSVNISDGQDGYTMVAYLDDVTGDGYGDLACSDYQYRWADPHVGWIQGAGRLGILMGGTNLSFADAIDQTGIYFEGSATHTYLGGTMDSTDVDGDGVNDFLYGGNGGARLHYGPISSGSYNETHANAWWTGMDVGLVRPDAGDNNGDGYGDILLGSIGDTDATGCCIELFLGAEN